jgi:hypothetical protein
VKNNADEAALMKHLTAVQQVIEVDRATVSASSRQEYSTERTVDHALEALAAVRELRE